MNTEIQERWAVKLESGEYIQGKGSLQTGVGFCCLGVLCDMYCKETGKGGWNSHGSIYNFVIDGVIHNSYLPSEVIEWAGLSSGNPFTIKGQSLAKLNDSGLEFKDIAALIRQGLRGPVDVLRRM